MKNRFFWFVLRNTSILLRKKGRLEEQRMKKKMPGMHLQISTRMLMSPRGPPNSWKIAGKKLEKKQQQKKHKNLDASDRKERFRTGRGPVAVPDDPIAQTVGDILQRRFDPLPNPYDDDADPRDKTHPFLLSAYVRNN